MMFKVEIDKEELWKYCEQFDTETRKWTDTMQEEISSSLKQFAEHVLDRHKNTLVNEALMDWDI